MKKRIVTVLMVSLLAVSMIAGCGNKADGSETKEDIAALREEIESLRAQLNENAALQEEVESLRAQLDEKEQDSVATVNTEDKAGISGMTEKDSVTEDEVDFDKVYEAVKEWTDDNKAKLSEVAYWKCVLINDDNIPEIVLFTKYSGLHAIITVDNRNQVTFIDSIKEFNGVKEEIYTPYNDMYEVYHTNLDRLLNNGGPSFDDTKDADDSQVFHFNPKESSFACTYVSPPTDRVQNTANVYLKLSDNIVEQVGMSGITKFPQSESMYSAGTFRLGEATKDIYEEYNAGFSYTDSFVVKSDCKISLESAFEAYKEEVQ